MTLKARVKTHINTVFSCINVKKEHYTQIKAHDFPIGACPWNGAHQDIVSVLSCFRLLDKRPLCASFPEQKSIVG